MAGLRIHIVMDPYLVARIDGAKAIGQSRGDFVRRTLEQALGGQGSGDTRRSRESGSVGEVRATEHSAPAQAPMDRAAMFRQATERK